MQSLNNVTDLGILAVTHLSAFYQLIDQLFVESPTRSIEMCNCAIVQIVIWKDRAKKSHPRAKKRKNEEFNQRYKLRRIKNRTVLYLR